LDAAAGEVLARAWATGADPGEAPVTIDVDSTVCEVAGKTKHGAAYGHTGRLGYHTLVATRAETGEILHTRLRGGSSQRGHVHFIAETVARTRRAGAAGELTVRADSGFFGYDIRLNSIKAEVPRIQTGGSAGIREQELEVVRLAGVQSEGVGRIESAETPAWHSLPRRYDPGI
jgi:hypothetical protein